MARSKKDRNDRPGKSPEVPKKKSVRVKEPLTTGQKLWIGGILAILAIAIYAPSYEYDFVYDDAAVIKENRFVQQGLAGLDEIWSTSYFQGYDENMNARAFRPVPLTTLAFEYQIWGLNPAVHHIFNILFYGLTAFFLFLFLSKLLRSHHPFLPIALSLFFIFHPIHVEVVANIKSRDTMLGFLNLVIAGWLLLEYLEKKKITWLASSLFFYLAALFSKEEIITSLATLPLMLYFFRKPGWGKIFRMMLPYAGAVIVFLIYRSSILGGLNEGVTLTEYDNSLLAANGPAQRIASNILVLGHYLLKTIWPHPLISDYSYMTIPLVNWDDWRVYVSLIANLGLLALGIHGFVKRKVYGFGPLFYFISVSIFTSILITNVSAYNDRFLYIPVLGICFLVAYGLSLLLKGNTLEPAAFFRQNFTPVAIVVLLCGAGLYKIGSQLPYWKDRYALFDHDLLYAPNNARLLKNHGGSLARLAVRYQTSEPEKAQDYARQSIEFLKKALDIYPRIPTGWIHMGNMYIILKEYDKAVAALKDALQLYPDNVYARSSLGNVYYRQGQYQESIRILEEIPERLRFKSDYQVLWRDYQAVGNTVKAEENRVKYEER